MNTVQAPPAAQMWDAVAEAWGSHADFLDARARGLTDRLIELAKLQSGDRVLDLAAGPGGTGIAAARQVAPGGTVVVSDISPRMIAVASARTKAQGVSNVETRVLDLEAIDEADGAFDAVICRDGLMLVPDPTRAAKEIRRVLREDGRFALAVWGPPERNPWLGLIFRAVAEQTGLPVPPPGAPGPFALADAGRLALLLADAGLTDVRVEEFAVPYQAGSVDEWLQRSSGLAGPLAQQLATLSDADRLALRTRIHEAAAPFTTAGGVEFPGLGLVASGKR